MKYTVRHYAEALHASCGDADTLKHCIADLASVAEHLAEDESVRTFFTTKTISTAQQEKVLRAVFKDFLGKKTYAFLVALMTNRQCALLERIIVSAERLVDREEGTARVAVESATVLGAAARTRLEEALSKKLHRSIRATYRIQPNVIAGFRLTIDGGTEWDGTIAGQLHRLHERIRIATA